MSEEMKGCQYASPGCRYPDSGAPDTVNMCPVRASQVESRRQLNTGNTERGQVDWRTTPLSFQPQTNSVRREVIGPSLRQDFPAFLLTLNTPKELPARIVWQNDRFDSYVPLKTGRWIRCTYWHKHKQKVNKTTSSFIFSTFGLQYKTLYSSKTSIDRPTNVCG